MFVCKRNGERNGVETIEHRLADWSTWDDAARYDWILGSDILYGEALPPSAPDLRVQPRAGGRILLSDPFRGESLRLLEAMEENGWAIALSKWQVGEEATMRPVGLFELAPPR